MKRVAITGIGAVTPLGNTFEDSWKAALEGCPGIGRISRFDASGLAWQMAGEVRGFRPGQYLSRKEVLHHDPFVLYGLAASAMALKDAALAGGRYVESGGVIIGSSRGGISSMEKAILKNTEACRAGRKARFSPYLMPSSTISAASSFSAQKLGLKGHCMGISNACASGTNAVGEAYRLIKAGYPGPMLAGGTEAPVCWSCVQGYGAAGALSDHQDASASRPFDRSRNGFVLAEGAAVMLLEDLDIARKRGARVYAEIAGYACTADAFHITQPDEEGEARAIRLALEDAAVSAEEVEYISSHGTSTRLGDRVEAAALRRVFGERTGKVPVSALKSMTGHMLGASGPLEAAFTAMVLSTGSIPPTINLHEQDEACDLSIVRQRTEADISLAVSPSFGFGGVNAVLALKRAAE
ncbi:MAG: beta-ketoacyl-ACP synthase II [Nitrospirae bacterium]|nr:MAG: beta-ketoacyl-ACP synthase II [Nitrospirota bacterium]